MGIVIGFVGFAVGEVGGSESVAAADKVDGTSDPEGFEVEQVAGVFLRGPFFNFALIGGFAGARGKDFGVDAVGKVFETSGSAAEADAKIGEEFDGE